MRVPLLRQALLAGICLLWGCSTPHAGSSGTASPTPVAGSSATAASPSMVKTSSSVPAASPSKINDSDLSDAVSKNEAEASFDNLEILDPSLKGKLAVLRVGSDPTDNNLVSVFVGLKNRTSHSLPLEVQTIYKDKSGNPMNQGSWIPMTLKPHEQTEYRSTSISVDASDFLVRIRTAITTGDN